MAERHLSFLFYCWEMNELGLIENKKKISDQEKPKRKMCCQGIYTVICIFIYARLSKQSKKVGQETNFNQLWNIF